MDTYKDINKIKMVFFSGTGSTAVVAQTFQKCLEAHGKIVINYELNRRNTVTFNDVDMLIITYPVHACNAPEPIYEYIQAVPYVNNIPAVVISVSGGGEITPNTACRRHCIKRLEKKGFNVIYEKMIVMPSNWIVPTIDELAVRLIEILPQKIERIVNDVFSGVIRRIKPDLLNRLLSHLGELEKPCSRYFGRKMKVGENCTGCGLCEKTCPRTNITLINGRPYFSDACTLCLKCIYGCPQKSIVPGIGKFIVIKQGYNLNAAKKQVGQTKQHSVEELAKGYLWKGVKEYLLEND
jgi:ferredoxin/flavodoxin